MAEKPNQREGSRRMGGKKKTKLAPEREREEKQVETGSKRERKQSMS